MSDGELDRRTLSRQRKSEGRVKLWPIKEHLVFALMHAGMHVGRDLNQPDQLQEAVDQFFAEHRNSATCRTSDVEATRQILLASLRMSKPSSCT